MAQQATLPGVKTSIVVSATPLDPQVDFKNAEIFRKTLFSRDDQIFHQLNAGINAGQHEGGGKSIEVRRFGFNLDHGGVSGGLKVLVDNVQQNQTTQGHGQGYLGSLKSLTPELVEEAQIINGPFNAEYGDFSGLGVVHIRLRESFPDLLTVRMQGGSFNSQRGFVSLSPDWKKTDAFFAFEGTNTDGPFVRPLGYRRDNLTGNVTRHIGERRSIGFKWNGGTNSYDSSGQIPLALVASGALDRFGYLDPGEGGEIRAATLAGYFRQETAKGATWKADGFVTRSLFDLYSNFTFFLNDPVNGDAIQQHDSRLVEGANLQYVASNRLGGGFGQFVAGGNYHDNQISVGLYSRIVRDPIDTLTAANARVTNSAGYLQQTSSFLAGRLTLGAGLRYDWFRFGVQDRVAATPNAAENSARFQPKLSAAFAPKTLSRIGGTFHFNYGRGIASIDARSILKAPGNTKLSTTDFSQAGFSARWSRVGIVGDLFLIDRSNEMVYVADDGTLELLGRSRAYGAEVKAAVQITSKLSFNGGITKVANAFYRATNPREYVDRAPHFTANAALTLSQWRGWSGSLRMRAINHYMLNTDDTPQTASGHTVTDFSVARRLSRNVEFNFSADNLFNRSYFETQNWVESRPAPMAFASSGIHGTPGYPRTITVGITARFGGK
jgi:outer membrane receptor protein involved in Fe transport